MTDEYRMEDAAITTRFVIPRNPGAPDALMNMEPRIEMMGRNFEWCSKKSFEYNGTSSCTYNALKHSLLYHLSNANPKMSHCPFWFWCRRKMDIESHINAALKTKSNDLFSFNETIAAQWKQRGMAYSDLNGGVVLFPVRPATPLLVQLWGMATPDMFSSMFSVSLNQELISRHEPLMRDDDDTRSTISSLSTTGSLRSTMSSSSTESIQRQQQQSSQGRQLTIRERRERNREKMLRRSKRQLISSFDDPSLNIQSQVGSQGSQLVTISNQETLSGGAITTEDVMVQQVYSCMLQCPIEQSHYRKGNNRMQLSTGYANVEQTYLMEVMFSDLLKVHGNENKYYRFSFSEMKSDSSPEYVMRTTNNPNPIHRLFIDIDMVTDAKLEAEDILFLTEAITRVVFVVYLKKASQCKKKEQYYDLLAETISEHGQRLYDDLLEEIEQSEKSADQKKRMQKQLYKSLAPCRYSEIDTDLLLDDASENPIEDRLSSRSTSANDSTDSSCGSDNLSYSPSRDAVSRNMSQSSSEASSHEGEPKNSTSTSRKGKKVIIPDCEVFTFVRPSTVFVEGDKVGKAKNGVHMIWPNVFVDTKTQLLIRTMILRLFVSDDYAAQHFSKRFGNVNWFEAIDEGVCKPGGACRMMGMGKGYLCNICAKGRGSDTCDIRRKKSHVYCGNMNYYDLFSMSTCDGMGEVYTISAQDGYIPFQKYAQSHFSKYMNDVRFGIRFNASLKEWEYITGIYYEDVPCIMHTQDAKVKERYHGQDCLSFTQLQELQSKV